MSDPPKKFTFGFSKVVKKSNLVAPPPVTKEKTSNVQFIQGLEANSIVLKEGEEQEKAEEPLVIPIIGPRKSSTLSILTNGKSIAEIAEDFSDVGDGVQKSQSVSSNISLPSDSLEAQAAREILQEGADTLKEKAESTLESLPEVQNREELQKESTLEDYESIPVNQFGLAMLRGMGWKPDEGIGKNKKLVPVTAPVVRPKGMGLGADKVLLAAVAAKSANSKKDEEELKMVKGAYVKVLLGSHRDQYAQIEGFNDDSGRVVLKMAIGGHVITISEAAVALVSKSEYTQNSKVINAAKFNEYKKKEEQGDTVKRRNSPTPEQKVQRPPPSSRKEHSPKREHSLSPPHKHRKERNYSRSKSKERYESKSHNSSKSNRERSFSPSEYKSRKGTPEESVKRKKSKSSRRARSSSRSPVKSSRRSRSTSFSPVQEKYTKKRKDHSDSEDDYRTDKKKKKKHKERKRELSSSSPDRNYRSKSRSPKRKKKEKKHRSRSRSPSSRRHR